MASPVRATAVVRDSCEVAPAGTHRPAPRRACVEPCDEDEEYLELEEHVEAMDCETDDEQ